MVRKGDEEVSLVSGSLFSGGGVGDVGIEWGAKIPVLAACELVPSRAALIRSNFPDLSIDRLLDILRRLELISQLIM